MTSSMLALEKITTAHTQERTGQDAVPLTGKLDSEQYLSTTVHDHNPKHSITLGARDEGVYPEGGRKAYLSLLGSFCAWMSAFGLMNTVGTFQAYLTTHQLSHFTESDVGWIFSLYLFMAYCCGVQAGVIFDAAGPRYLTAVGSVCLVASMLLLGFCQGMSVFKDNAESSFVAYCCASCSDRNDPEYYHFILVFSIIGGLGTCLLSTVAIGTIGHWFNVRRGFATGLASCAGSLGGIFFPLMLSSLFASTGFAWATRALGFIFVFLLIFANLLIRSRLPGKPMVRTNIIPDPRIFKDITFLVMTLALSMIELGLFSVLSYIITFALSVGIRSSLAYQLLSVLNAGSFFGRWAPGLLADKIGRFNTMILMIFLCMLTTLALWLPSALTSSTSARETLLILFALLFGFASGSNITLGPVCAGQLCKTEDYGRYFASCFTVVGISSLLGIPIAGQILLRSNGSYVGLIIFGGASYALGLVLMIWARVRAVGWGWGRENIY